MNTECTAPALQSATPELLGDLCPSWCGGDHMESRFRDDGRPLHPDDAGMYHHSPTVDSWHPQHGDGWDEDAIDVRIEGFRHDNGDDWPDTIHATNVCPGFLSDVGLEVPDARRLAEAILLACDLAEGKVPA